MRYRCGPSSPADPMRIMRRCTSGCCSATSSCSPQSQRSYLSGRISNTAVTASEVDRLMGAVAETADGSFNVILELGFAESIRREWVWRRSRGESTANLAAFAHLDPESDRH